MATELWKDIEEFPGYQVSNHGRVRSFKDFRGNITTEWKIIKPVINKDGYYELTLYTIDHKKVTKRVHRLVINTFIGEHPELVVNHIDGVKTNNFLNNLEFVTAEQNSTLASELGLYKTKSVRVLETGEIFNSVKDCARALNVHPSDISHHLSGRDDSIKGLHIERMDVKKNKKQFLYDYQMDAVGRMSNGCVLNGGVGSGKSRTALYYYFKEQGGSINPDYIPMKERPQDLYIITTARKRDTLEWEGELTHFLLSTDQEKNELYRNKIVVDSWNNIQKYANVTGAFFIFDEQRVVGYGSWVKNFLKITKRNNWILLSATVGDTWQDYIPLFIANGFYRNKTEFNQEHVVYSRFSKYPKIDRYINTGRLIRQRNQILVDMDFNPHTIQHHEDVYVEYDRVKYKEAIRTRWDPFKNEPMQQASSLCYVLRRIVNESENRVAALMELLEKCPRAIIFYNFDYELDILLNLCAGTDVPIAQWNGHKHQEIPESDKWIYLVQYTAGCEGWNCIKTDTIIFFSQNYSYKIMSQACGRIRRLNTPYKDLYYYHLKSRSGIDLAIAKAIREKKNFNEGKWAKWYA